MKKRLTFTVVSAFLLSACGGGSGSSDDIPALKADVNVASASQGASASSKHNSTDANNLIDGNSNTSWTSESGKAITVDFGRIETIKEITLTRQAARATFGSNPDILVELSTNGSSYSASNISTVFGGIACTSQTMNNTSMNCKMTGHETRYIRITSQNSKAYDFFELEVIANK